MNNCSIPYDVQLTEEYLNNLLKVELCNCTSLNRDDISCSSPRSNPIFEISYSILFIIVIALSIIGNCIVMWIVLKHDKMRTVTNYYLLNLAIADTSISIFNTAVTYKYLVYYNWTLGDEYCAFNNAMGIAPICASVFTMIVMSIDRYWAVVHPLRNRPGRKATVAVIVFIWFLSIILSLPAALASYTYPLFDYYEEILTKSVVCLADNFIDGKGEDSTLFSWYTASLSLIQYMVPLSILSYTYWRVGGVLNEKEYVGDVRHYRNIAAKKKASKMLSLVVAIFMIVWLPYHAYFLLFLVNPRLL